MSTLATVGALTMAFLAIKRAEYMDEEGCYGKSGMYFVLALLCLFYIGAKAFTEVFG